MRVFSRGLLALFVVLFVVALGITPVGAVQPVGPAGNGPAIRHHQTSRACATPRPGHASCFAIRQTDTAEPSALRVDAVAPDATPAGYSPASLRSAYGLTASGTAGRVVAIVDAYDDPTAEADLAAYRAQFGLPACTTANGCFRKVNQAGASTPLPLPDTGWSGEISLDLDMVSAICPNCSILLVEADSSSADDLFAAVDRAVLMGAKFVSNSYGGPEWSDAPSYDTHFNHPGVVFTASTGDLGYGVQYPAASKYVTAVGGTSLTTANNARGWTETTWNGAGSGCSAYEAKPTFQNAVTTGCTRRSVADVSAVADPDTGVAVYQGYGGAGWTVYGGTSAAAPIIASVFALAGLPGANDFPNSYPYSHQASFNDINTGSNGSCGSLLCTGGVGWDGPTGLGTPKGTAAFAPASASPVTVGNPGNRSATTGTAFSLALSATGGTGAYSWSATGLPTGLSINSSTGVVSGTPTVAGSASVTVKAVSGTSSGTTTFVIAVTAQATTCPATQLLGNAGFEGTLVSPWSASVGVVSSGRSGQTPRTGTRFAILDGYGSTHTDTLTQNITIPAGCANTRLTLYLKVATSETAGTAVDVLTIKVGTYVMGRYSNLNAGGYVALSFNIGTFAGRTVPVSFSAVENSSKATSFAVDDTAVRTAA